MLAKYALKCSYLIFHTSYVHERTLLRFICYTFKPQECHRLFMILHILFVIHFIS